MNEGLENYVPRKSCHPSLQEVCSELGIKFEELSYKKNSILVNKRILKWLNRAALQAYGTLNAIIHLYPKKHRKWYEPTLKELALIFENNLDNPENNKDVEKRVETIIETVAHAGNIFNNTAIVLPKEVRKAVLESRDICDEAVRQPKF